MSPFGPFIKLELPTGLIQGEASNCSPTLTEARAGRPGSGTRGRGGHPRRCLEPPDR